jgi:hypothetical protein
MAAFFMHKRPNAECDFSSQLFYNNLMKGSDRKWLYTESFGELPSPGDTTILGCGYSAFHLFTLLCHQFGFKSTVRNFHVLQPVAQIVFYFIKAA